MKRKVQAVAATLVLAAILVTASLAPAAAQTLPEARVAIIDVLLIQQKSTAMIGMKLQIEQRRQVYRDEAAGLERELRAEDEELAGQRMILAEDVFARKRLEFQARVAEAERNVQEHRRELAQAHNVGVEQVLRTVNEIIFELSSEYGFNVVLPRQQITFADTILDISDAVLRRLNQRLLSVDIPPPPN